MSGRFINTDRKGVLTHSSVMDSQKNLLKSILQNPYYLFSDKRASKCTYYNINTTMTTLDESIRGNYGEISPDSPIRYNKINDFFIYGVSKIEPNLEIGEYGLEGADISGDYIVLPYTIVPYPGDFFVLHQIDRPVMFKVTGVDPSTLDTGAIMYKISFTVCTTDGIEDIEPQVVKILNFLPKNIGTNFAVFIDEETSNNVSDLEDYSSKLKDYYISLFYDNKIQSFSYSISNDGSIGGNAKNSYGYIQHPGFRVYDPYLIEFMIRNKIFKGSTRYIHIRHEMVMPRTFAIDYDKTIFSSLEQCKLDTHTGTYVGNLLLCDQELSLLYQYPIDYYYMDYNKVRLGFHPINILSDPEFSNRVYRKEYYNSEKKEENLRNIIISYFLNKQIKSKELEILDYIDYLSNKDMFYIIPMIIFCIDTTIQNIMVNPERKAV